MPKTPHDKILKQIKMGRCGSNRPNADRGQLNLKGMEDYFQYSSMKPHPALVGENWSLDVVDTGTERPDILKDVERCALQKRSEMWAVWNACIG
jgi:hypothetical protein